MFVLKPKPTFKVPVVIPTPSGDKGKFTVEFKHKGKKELQEFFDVTEDKESSDLDKLAEIVVGWAGVDTPYNKEALEQLLDAYPVAAITLYRAYNAALFEGKVGAEAQKN